MQVMYHEQIRPLIEELASRLAASNAATGVRIVGGAAISLHGIERRPTRDIDAMVMNAGDINPIIADMARDFDLEANWCNDAAKAFVMPVGLEDWIEVHRSGDVVVSVASIDMLIAMNLLCQQSHS
jgi:hypothetical protein